MKRDLRKAEDEDNLMEKANNKEQWITSVAVQRSDNRPASPLQERRRKKNKTHMIKRLHREYPR